MFYLRIFILLCIICFFGTPRAEQNLAQALDTEITLDSEATLNSKNSPEKNNTETNILSVEDFFRKSEIDDATISPKGDMVVYEKFGTIMIGNADIPFMPIIKASNRYDYVAELNWVSDHVLIVERHNRKRGLQHHNIYEFGFDEAENKFVILRTEKIEKAGYIVDPMMHDPENILFARYMYDDGHSYTNVFKISLFEDKKKYMNYKRKINVNSGDIFYWMTDKRHKVTFGISYKNGIPSLWRKKGRGRRLSKIWTAESEIEFIPYKLTEDKNNLWVLTNLESDKLVAAQFNLDSNKIERVLYEKQNVDLTGIIIGDDDKSPLAVTYMDNGQLKYDFLNESAKQDFDNLQAKFPDQSMHVVDVSDDRSRQLVIISSKHHAGSLSLCNVLDSTCKAIGSLHPWLDDIELAYTESIKIKTEDNFEIESFLTVPSTNKDKPVPLIVMPHGGPIGESDNSYFTGDTQWLAYNGYAVLQVNYRGSGGYGKQFELSGMQQWGRAIEDGCSSFESTEKLVGVTRL